MSGLQALRDRVELLEEENRQLRASISPAELAAPTEWKLTPAEDAVFRRLRKGGPVTREAIEFALKNTGYSRTEYCSPNMASVYIHKLRKKLPAHWDIVSVWGVGYELITREISDA